MLTNRPDDRTNENEVTALHNPATTTDPTTVTDLTIHNLQTTIARLESLLWVARRRYADLVAAARATLGAHADGEPDPLSYLRDELPPPPPEHPLSGNPRRAGGDR